MYVDFFISKSYSHTEINVFSAWYTWDLYDATAFVSDYIILNEYIYRLGLFNVLFAKKKPNYIIIACLRTRY